MASNTIPLSSIPTVHQLYSPLQSTVLTLYPCTRPLRSASRAINDRVSLHHGDITKLRIDAIVNATNTDLRPGGGVDHAIHAAAGPDLRAELQSLYRGVETGQAVLSGGHNLPARHVIHTVGPIYASRVTNGGSGDADPSPFQLASCYRSSLDLAVRNGIKTVAFPCIGTGVYGFPQARATKVACETVRAYLDEHGPDEIQRVIFCCFEDRDVTEYLRLIPKYFPSLLGQ